MPAGIFGNLAKTPNTAQLTLNLSGNEFTSVPKSFFTGMDRAMAALDMTNQSGNSSSSLVLPVALYLAPDGVATLTMKTGTPVPLTFPLDISGHETTTPPLSPTEVTIAQSATSGTAPLLEASGQTLTAALMDTLPTLPVAVTGLRLVGDYCRHLQPNLAGADRPLGGTQHQIHLRRRHRVRSEFHHRNRPLQQAESKKYNSFESQRFRRA